MLCERQYRIQQGFCPYPCWLGLCSLFSGYYNYLGGMEGGGSEVGEEVVLGAPSDQEMGYAELVNRRSKVLAKFYTK